MFGLDHSCTDAGTDTGYTQPDSGRHACAHVGISIRTPESGNSVKNSAALPFSGPNCGDVSGEGFGTESDLELELVQSSANFDCN